MGLFECFLIAVAAYGGYVVGAKKKVKVVDAEPEPKPKPRAKKPIK